MSCKVNYFAQAESLYSRADYKKAVKLYKKAIKTEDQIAEAANRIAYMYIKGLPTGKPDSKKARKYLQLAKDNGHSTAGFRLRNYTT